MYNLPLTTAPPTSCVGCGYGAKFCQCPSGYCADVIVVAATTATADTNHFIERLRSRNRIETSFGNHSIYLVSVMGRGTGACTFPCTFTVNWLNGTTARPCDVASRSTSSLSSFTRASSAA